MKQLLTSLLLGLSVLASAQNDGFQYPFPYNPDGNSDGYISLPDMLDLLAVYGQAFPQTFYGDSTGAILEMGQMGFDACLAAAREAGPSWRMATRKDLIVWGNSIGNSLSEEFNSGGPTNYDILYYTGAVEEFGRIRLTFNVNWGETAGIPNLQTITPYYELDMYGSGQCYLATTVMAEIEYDVCTAISDGYTSTPTNTTTLEDCVNQKLSEGWKLLGGVARHNNDNMQALWRYKD